jgi:hypothetical protein
MVDERLKEVHATDLAESRVNEDFVEWLKTKGPQYLLLVLVGVCIYLGVVRWKQYKVTYFNNAWTELVACELPGSYEDVAERYADVPGLPQQALRFAADTWLNAVQTGRTLGGEGAAAATDLTDEQREDYLQQAERLYHALSNADDGSLAMTLYAVSAMQGVAVVAECKGDTAEAERWYTMAADRAETFYPELARRVRERASTSGDYAEAVVLPTQAELPTPATPAIPATLEPATIDEALRELLLPGDAGAG